jgi:hypothetical protein
VADEAKAKAEAEKVEQAEIDSYMDVENSGGDGPTSEERLAFLKTRYAQVKEEYKLLQLQREEIEATKKEDLLPRVNQAFSANYKTRKFLVKELRKAGEKVEDRFIPLSA